MQMAGCRRTRGPRTLSTARRGWAVVVSAAGQLIKMAAKIMLAVIHRVQFCPHPPRKQVLRDSSTMTWEAKALPVPQKEGDSFFITKAQYNSASKTVGVRQGGLDCTAQNPLDCLMAEIGNGYFATVGPICAADQSGCGSLFLAGVFEYGFCGSVFGSYGVQCSYRANLPNPFYRFLPKIDSWNAIEQVQVQDFKNACLMYYFGNVRAENGKTVTVQMKFYAHRKRRNLFVLELSNDQEADTAVNMVKHAAVVFPGQNGAPGLSAFETTAAGASSSGTTGTSSDVLVRVRQGSTSRKEDENLQKSLLKFAEAQNFGDDYRLLRAGSSSTAQGQRPGALSFSKANPVVLLSAYASSNMEEVEG
ncbi:unnamed protein product [Amoebophrya sp. A120]|nr:unnamed protein product [Amoebophrya sp. A120]|eukprot:GSA120T00007127001.1